MIILLAPELDALLSESDSSPTLLKKLFARSQLRALDANGFLAELVTGQPVAPAPIERLSVRPDDCQGCWAFADPIDLRPDLSAVWIQAARFDALDHAAVSELRTLFEEVAGDLDLCAPERGFLRLQQTPKVSFTPPWDLAGQSLDYVLPKGAEAADWIGLLNECQVLLHQHAADGTGLPSGLWFWGAGELPVERPVARVSHLIGVEAGLSGLANWLKLSHAPDEMETSDATLRVWQPEVTTSASEALKDLAEIIRPIWRRLLIGSIDAIEVATRSRAWRVSSADARRFWRRAS